MLKVNDLLDRTSKIVSSVAAISLGLAIIAGSAVVVKENLKDLLHLKKVRAHVICVNSSTDIPEEPVEKESKESSKKGSSKKGSSKPTASNEEVAAETK